MYTGVYSLELETVPLAVDLCRSLVNIESMAVNFGFSPKFTFAKVS